MDSQKLTIALWRQPSAGLHATPHIDGDDQKEADGDEDGDEHQQGKRCRVATNADRCEESCGIVRFLQ